MKIKIKNVSTLGDLSLERFYPSNFRELQSKYGLPSYKEIEKLGDVSKLWIECHDIEIAIYAIINGKKTLIFYSIKRGFTYDKASTPLGKDNTLESDISTRVHDIGCSTHCLEQFEENNDSGFRCNNKLFYELLKYFIKREKDAQLRETKSNWKRFKIRVDAYKRRRRARGWYLAVSSIPGQAFYENNERDWHKKTTSVEIR